LLTEHYDEVKQSHYSLLLSQFDALLGAYAGRHPTLARQFALNAAGNAVTSNINIPSAGDATSLYELAQQGFQLRWLFTRSCRRG